MPAALSATRLHGAEGSADALTIKGERLDLAGIRFWTRRLREIAGVLSGTGGTTVLLAHDPRRLVEAAALDVQLVLSATRTADRWSCPASVPVARTKVSGARRLRDPREHDDVRQPRRGNGLRAGADQLPAGCRGADASQQPGRGSGLKRR